MTRKILERIHLYLPYAVLIFAIVSMFLSTSRIYFSDELDKPSSKEQMEIDKLRLKIEELGNTQYQINSQINKVLSSTPDSTLSLYKIDLLRAQVDSINTYLSDMKRAIMLDPLETIALPMLKVEMENEQERTSRELAYVTKELDRITSWLYFLVSTFGALLIAIITLNLRKPWEKLSHKKIEAEVK